MTGGGAIIKPARNPLAASTLPSKGLSPEARVSLETSLEMCATPAIDAAAAPVKTTVVKASIDMEPSLIPHRFHLRGPAKF